MPKYSAVVFHAEPVVQDSKVLGYVISGFMTEKQLRALQEFVDGQPLPAPKRWRGQYGELVKAISTAARGVFTKIPNAA